MPSYALGIRHRVSPWSLGSSLRMPQCMHSAYQRGGNRSRCNRNGSKPGALGVEATPSARGVPVRLYAGSAVETKPVRECWQREIRHRETRRDAAASVTERARQANAETGSLPPPCSRSDTAYWRRDTGTASAAGAVAVDVTSVNPPPRPLSATRATQIVTAINPQDALIS